MNPHHPTPRILHCYLPPHPPPLPTPWKFWSCTNSFGIFHVSPKPWRNWLTLLGKHDCFWTISYGQQGNAWFKTEKIVFGQQCWPVSPGLKFLLPLLRPLNLLKLRILGPQNYSDMTAHDRAMREKWIYENCKYQVIQVTVTSHYCSLPSEEVTSHNRC